jgi:Required for nuclear transport of RNA pol II C-terminus 1
MRARMMKTKGILLAVTIWHSRRLICFYQYWKAGGHMGQMGDVFQTLTLTIGNPNLTPGNTPTLQVIFSHLEPFTNNPSDSIRKPALEARLIITARGASSATPRPKEEKLRPPDHEIYQDALKLLQDPILPVRAHGLLMLRQLVVPTDRNNGVEHILDQSLVPAILDIFMQSVQDDDSFVFLNAVQGLAAMVHRLGRDILYRLVDIYTRGAEDPSFGVQQNDLDKRLRIGEALEQVIRRCGDALSIYGALFVRLPLS